MNENVSVSTALLLYRDAISNFLTNQFYKGLPDEFALNSKAVDLFCQNIITIFRGILNEAALKQFDETMKSRELLMHY